MVIEMKKYNNLFDSICMTILTLLFFSAGVCCEYFGVITNDNNINKIGTSVIIITFFVLSTIVSLSLIFKFCYEKWWMEDDAICSKKLLHRPIKIKFNEIDFIDESIVPALIFDTFKSEAIIIKGKNKTITILKNKYVEKNKLSETIKNKTNST